MQVTIGVPPDRGEKGEDWEHEEERADDDLEQGDEEGSDHDLNLTVKKYGSIMPEVKCLAYLYYTAAPALGIGSFILALIPASSPCHHHMPSLLYACLALPQCIQMQKKVPALAPCLQIVS